MKFRLLLLLVAIPAPCLPSLHAGDVMSATKSERPETELEQAMGKMGKAWRQVRKANREGRLSPACADYVATVRSNAERASRMIPALEAEQPAGERAKFQADFEASMKKLVAVLSDLEAALKANNLPTASRLVGEAGELMKSGHHDFKKPDEPGGRS
ncbi:MAG: hypothetical protein JWM88_381 [Verrucomicrobia bacterium]|nr:hypothetical protein [Verrucomicrobiota bacterium]